jgi:2,4-didehydro-3-deoxy-L-rhamnonate hydrolase
MKLVRYGKPGKEKPGLIDLEGKLRDLSDVIPDLGPAQLSPKSLAKLAKLKTAKLPAVRGKPRLGVPFTGASKFVAIGLNYSDHAKETGNPIPTEPVVFHKTLSCMQGPNDDVMLPKDSKKSDWEAELGIVIGSTARYVTKKDALSHVAGYCIVNDVSTWDKGKGFDTFGPVGPWLVTPDEVGDPGKLDIWLDVNGEARQRGTTKTMIFDCAELIVYVSRLCTLNPGDLITTGTPPGVGHGMKPPQYLKPGDVMTVGIQGLGEQTQKVLKFKL